MHNVNIIGVQQVDVMQVKWKRELYMRLLYNIKNPFYKGFIDQDKTPTAGPADPGRPLSPGRPRGP